MLVKAWMTREGQISGQSPLSSYTSTLKQRLNGEEWDVELRHSYGFGWAVLFSCPVFGRMFPENDDDGVTYKVKNKVNVFTKRRKHADGGKKITIQ